MKRLRPSPALVISLIALFVALGGTSYAAITSLPKNSVGTQQLKNRAVSAAKLNASVYRSTLPSGATETGEWGVGGEAHASTYVAAPTSFRVPLAHGLDGSHTIYAGTGSITHCSGPGHADRGYLCMYEGNNSSGYSPANGDIWNPEGPSAITGTGVYGFAIRILYASGGSWYIGGSYAVTAP